MATALTFIVTGRYPAVSRSETEWIFYEQNFWNRIRPSKKFHGGVRQAHAFRGGVDRNFSGELHRARRSYRPIIRPDRRKISRRRARLDAVVRIKRSAQLGLLKKTQKIYQRLRHPLVLRSFMLVVDG